ncbi:MAG: RnfABCDGE type electron transport complex subunit D, partial [Gammaproteobacteria bacterium]|nr:RnfABCDGE type electron transport complex subunit D [Gammaproteobacteria bacterium]
ALAGAAACAALFGALSDPGDALSSLPWYWHPAIGNLAFVVAFIATDPTTNPTTRAGRWIFGALVGSAIVLVRLADPTHPESSSVVLMLCMLAIPLIDHISLRYHIRRRMRAGQRA